MVTPKLIIHGGAGAREGDHARAASYDEALRRIVAESFEVLRRDGARAAVIAAITCLEDAPLFNAGTGSRLQRDGVARMSAALMDSQRLSLAAVFNIEAVRNPIQVVATLREARHPLRAGAQALAYARAAGFPAYDVVTEHRREEHARALVGHSGTVGAVAIDASGLLCAGTSTGGVGFEDAGRVSDAPTVAGTYVTRGAGVSCTGAGEDIVNQAVAARLLTRVDDGLDLADAAQRTLHEGDAAGYRYGLIALDRHGRHFAGQTAEVTTVYAVTDGARLVSFHDALER